MILVSLLVHDCLTLTTAMLMIKTDVSVGPAMSPCTDCEDEWDKFLGGNVDILLAPGTLEPVIMVQCSTIPGA